MNVRRFNEGFEQAEKELIASAKTKPHIPATWRVAPLFNYESQYSREIQLLKDATTETQFRLPFSVMRLAVTEHDAERGRYQVHFVVDGRDSDEITMMVLVRDLFHDLLPPSDSLWRRVMPMAFYVSQLRWNERDTENQVLYNSAFRYAGRWVRPFDLKGDELIMLNALRDTYVNGAVDALAAFALDSMSPAFHLAEVKPDQPGRSVEWTRQRTHYTLIHHGHPVSKMKPSQNGLLTVNVDKNEELTRMAHARRAHYKTLRHPRYRFMRGKTIFVRAAWVGPKEWREEGSKQIYRILEPVGDEL